jgi:periplasmic protein TonB
MSTTLILNNLVLYCLQIGMLVGVAAFVPALLRLRQPGARLVYWYILLAVCLLLPLQPWKPALIAGTVQISTIITAVRPATHATRYFMPRSEMILILLAAGIVFRLGFLVVGFWKLRRYRQRSQALQPTPTWGVEAALRISADLPSPVTFGWRKPVVLLPERFPMLDGRVQDAILCHEVLHVRRHDWLFTLAEELIRAIFWFHPAIWWLLGEIGLAREQEVDRLAIQITNQRDEYMDALLAIAGASAKLDLAPAPLFLRKRHLKQRVVLILTEASMSKTRLISALAASVAVLVAACWLVTGTLPLMAAPQVVNDAPGVTVGLSGASLLHRAPVEYPLAALRAGVQGTLSVEVRVDVKGNVSDARVLSGPDELRKAALQSVLQWHFAGESAGATRVVQITFELPTVGGVLGGVIGSAPEGAVAGVIGSVPAGGVPGVVGGVSGGVARGVPGGVLGGVIGSVPAGSPPPPPPPPALQTMTVRRTTDMNLPIRSITVAGLPDQPGRELMALLPVHEGDTFTTENARRLDAAVREFDEHLTISSRVTSDGVSITVQAPYARMSMPGTIKVGGNVQDALVLKKVNPEYPPLAKAARVSGIVHLAIVIAKDGTVQEIHSLGGPALLIQAAMDAVKQWVYRPTLLNGAPTTVETTVDIVFSLSE